jgi:hypothetical protein
MLVTPSLVAQSFDLDRGRQPLVSLDGLWRFHPGDSPNANNGPNSGFLWASPDFDDSAWPLIRADSTSSDQGYPGLSGYAWYRCTLHIPPGDTPTSILIPPIVTGFRFFVDGNDIGGAGTMPPSITLNPRFSYSVFPLTASGSPSDRTVHIAIRVWHSPAWSSYMGGGFYLPGGLAGAPTLIAAEQRHHYISHALLFVDQYAYSIASSLIGLAILCLFFFRPMEREYLWFAILVLAQSADCALTVSKEMFAFPAIPIFDMMDAALNAAIFGANLCFISRIFNVPLGRWGRFLLALLILCPITNVLYWPGLASVPVAAALYLCFLLPCILWALYLLVRNAIQGNQDARLLLLPIFMASGYYAFDNLVILLAQASLVRRPVFMDEPLPLPPFSLHIQMVLDLVFLLAMLVFLIRRFSIARRQEQRLAGEFEAAREIQQVLLPDELDQCPGFSVESIYQPAEQVGGDFFQQIADGNGGMLIVVGDVSGKGLPAAMIVSVLVGAIRAEAAHGATPSALLASLNDRMMGRAHGGFVTCLAAHLTANGRLTMANAGHLPPYLNGEEMPAPSALPLGLLKNILYESLTFDLAPSDRLTFVSDGVVEAQSRSGELFGFDRTRNVSRTSAHAIAQAAQNFGQQDDITVVTVEFSGAPRTDRLAPLLQSVD